MLEYEKKHRNTYYSQFFLVAGSVAKLSTSCHEILEALELTADASPDDNSTIEIFFQSLSGMSNWLLLIDNVGQEEVDTIRRLLPVRSPGHVVASSQLRSVIESLTDNSMELGELNPDEATTLFMASGYEPLQSNYELAAEVVNEVGRLPHAIEQVASYIKLNNLDMETFLDKYRQMPSKVLEWNDGHIHHRSSVAKHFNMIFQTLEESCPNALVVLRFYSMLEPESIPLFDTWTRVDEGPGFSGENEAQSPKGLGDMIDEPLTHLEDIFRDGPVRQAAIDKLWDLSLLRRVDNNRRVLWMHNLTKLAVRASISAANTEILIKCGLSVMYHMFPVEDTTAIDRAWVDICLPQCRALIGQAKARSVPISQYVALLALNGQANVSHGAVVIGLSQLEEAQPIYIKHLGLENGRTITLIQKLARANRFTGNLKKAEDFFRQALSLRESVSGPEAPETLEVMGDLASVIERAGRLKEAELMFKSLYKRYEAKDHDHPNTIAAAHNLGYCYHNQGRLIDAERMYKVALHPSETQLDSEDVGTLKTLSNLAATLDHQGRLDEAQSLYERAFPAFIKIFGPHHFLTVRLRGNIAGLRRQQGAFKQAEEMIKHCQDVVSRLYGRENFESITVLYELGEVFHAKGNIWAADNAYGEAIGLCVGDLANHPVSFRFLDASGIAKREMGYLEEAKQMSEKAYHRFHEMLGWDDPYTLVAANDLGELLHAEGKYEEARDMYEKCLVSLGKLVGKQHPHYLMVTNNLGRVQWALGTGQALNYFDEAYKGLDRLLGPNHFCTLTVGLNQARTRVAYGEFEPARETVRTIQAKLQDSIGDVHPLTMACELILGLIAASQAGLESAREHFTSAIEMAQKAGYMHSSDYSLGICFLVLVLRELGVKEDAVRQYSNRLDPSSPATLALSPWHIPGYGTVLGSVEEREMNTSYFIMRAMIPTAISSEDVNSSKAGC
ncbi:hypothetical protein O1611_g3542 [Lasiodiplodia mahajangana]|uniref:Uncharacterized protein n=1 Tax=Lasiodiplodia mahajangana TaxID=1108764 RepID=A0ACC2JRF1_9PEZI|nr:hypothetical protein O1611_g3542 [Lasiodiplodia mahajangana]